MIYALLSRIQLCHDCALFGGHFWPKVGGDKTSPLTHWDTLDVPVDPMGVPPDVPLTLWNLLDAPLSPWGLSMSPLTYWDSLFVPLDFVLKVLGLPRRLPVFKAYHLDLWNKIKYQLADMSRKLVAVCLMTPKLTIYDQTMQCLVNLLLT